jgi:uncharacterized membrane protein YkvA (DUF1232 family)
VGQDTRAPRGRKASRTGATNVRRLVGLATFLPLASRAPDYTRLVWALVRDDRTPPARKALLAGGLGYLVVGRDLVPDDMPVIGGLDDLVVVVLAVDLFLDGIPRDLLEEKLAELGIDERAFDEDMVRIRRLMPGPVRRVVRRLPGAIEAAADTVTKSGIGPRVRAWINKEGSIA